MKQPAKLTLILMTFLSLFIIPATAFAQGEPRLHLSSPQINVEVGQQTTAEVLVEGASAIYGTEFHLSFDPTLLEVVEINHGDFLSADPDNEAFVLQKEFNNETGTIDYAVSLLNPAPPAEGNGVLLQITFQGKAEGVTPIEFIDGLFGTQQGEEVLPLMENAEASILPGAGFNQSNPQVEQSGGGSRPVEQQTFFRSEDNGGRSSSTILGLSLVFGALMLGGIGVVVLIAIVGIWFWYSRSRRNKRPRNASAWS